MTHEEFIKGFEEWLRIGPYEEWSAAINAVNALERKLDSLPSGHVTTDEWEKMREAQDALLGMF
jgi:hypothetical protein